MYSRNDYRYYLENRLIHSDDFLAHYGVRGMKWKRRKLGVAEAKAREKRRNSKVIIIERKNQKTGEKTTRNPKVQIVTSKDYKKKRSKREAKWNRKMQNYGREALKEIQ